jgi:hypothetical protein
MPSQLPKPVLHVMPHAPDAHEADPLAALHALRHTPQWATAVLVLVSQPFEATLSQLPKPALQAPTAHAPAAHTLVALASEQVARHAPQCVADVERLVSQPLATTPSQLPKPALHVMPHAPDAQVAAPLVALHAAPHAPQCVGEVARLVSQPLPATPSQSPKPALQVKPHVPRAQVGVALGRAEHTVPHAPQLVRSVWRFTQRPAHIVVGGVHTVVQAGGVFEQTWPMLHDRPHMPQCELEVERSVSQPLVGLMSQLPKPASHVATAHAPAVHWAVARGSAQADPHVPQWVAEVRRSVSHPSLGSLSQSPYPASQRAMTHPPVEHAAVACASEHARRHIPQCVADVLRLVSQPLAGFVSQSPKPAAHAATAHVPFVHAGVALASEQARPQAPQWLTALRVLVSQPLATFMSQSPKPVAQAIEQRPAVHAAVPLAALHALPHAPQWAVVVERLVSHPLAALPSQSPKPALQRASVHVPPVQAATPLAKLHALPQRPQCVTEVWRSAHAPEHAVSIPQSVAHDPWRHTCVAGQARPHAPQWAGVDWRSASQPLAASRSQSPRLATQVITAHVPAAHVAVALGSAQARPHIPQWSLAVRVSVSQPLAALPSQSPKPALHATAQRPDAHEGVPLAALHALPHAPQWAAAVERSVSQPLAGFMSQSPKPALHVTAQRPATHADVPLGRAPQAFPQAPQCAESVFGSTHAPSQRIGRSAGHISLVHARLPSICRAHDCPAAHARPHAPQCAAEARSASQPLRTSPSQLAVPSLHTSSQARLALQVRYGLMT